MEIYSPLFRIFSHFLTLNYTFPRKSKIFPIFDKFLLNNIWNYSSKMEMHSIFFGIISVNYEIDIS